MLLCVVSAGGLLQACQPQCLGWCLQLKHQMLPEGKPRSSGSGLQGLKHSINMAMQSC